MAFAGLNVTFGTLVIQNGVAVAPIYGPATASENPAAPSAGSAVAPSRPAQGNQPGIVNMPIASVWAAADSWICFGPLGGINDPSVATSGRRFIPITTLVDVFVNPGDSFRWTTA